MFYNSDFNVWVGSGTWVVSEVFQVDFGRVGGFEELHEHLIFGALHFVHRT